MTDSPRSILARLERLKEAQEEQQRVLLEKHIAQQKLLEKEHHKMYEVLGLQHHIADDVEKSYDNSDSEPEYEETNLQAQLASEGVDHISAIDGTTMCDSDLEHPSPEEEEALRMKSNVPKRPFLKRGEGLRARFKVDPDKFKLNNIPTYKFANHNRERNNRKHGAKQVSLQSTDGIKPVTSSQKASKDDGMKSKREDAKRKSSEKQSCCKTDTAIILDVNRVKDKKLKSMKRQGGSLPPYVDADATNKNKGEEYAVPINVKQSSSELEMATNTNPTPDAPWKRRLDNPLAPIVSKEQRDLNFFELLEQKVVGKSFNSNSSSILRFIATNDSTVNEEMLINEVTVRNEQDDEPLLRSDDIKTMAGLDPAPSDVTFDDDTDDDCDSDESLRAGEEHGHVRFAQEGNSRPTLNDYSDVTDQESYNLKGMALSKMSTPNDKFVQHSHPLENTGQQDSSESDSDETGQSIDEETPVPVAGDDGDDTLRNEILAKSELLKERLGELEREIDSYRRENADLIRAKQEHELERMKLQQDREEMEERMNDERIKMEVYFHDERLKIEAERTRALKEAQKPNKKDREEILRLNEALTETKKQQKEREAKHSATLARFRAQIKNMEKDLQEVRLEHEVAKKDNRRLEMENARLKRQNNSRMLVEINRNIAKLAVGGVGEGERDKVEDKMSLEKANGVPETRGRIKSHPIQVTERRLRQSKQVKAKVISHPPARIVPAKGQGKVLPVHVSNLCIESDENEENNSHHNSSEEENMLDESDDDDDEVLGGDSSSAPTAEPSSYFPKHSVRKTLFSPVNVNDGPEPTKQGLMRREIPQKSGNEVLDHSSETAEMIKNLKREIVNADGSRDTWYPNGNLKKISPDGLRIRMLYFNKDIKETNMAEGTTKYYYSETNTWHTTYLDGLEILEFPDGQTEHRFKDGSTEVHFPNGSIRTTNPNSADIAEEWKYPDGTTVIIRKNDDKEINLPNGQLEIHTKAHKRRIYPDGTIKFVFPDGSQESRYSNGRVRLKDKDGRLISDTGGGVINGVL